MKAYQDYLCKIAKTHFILCHKCRKHENAQDWMRVNHDPSKGIKNIDIMYKAIGANHKQVNSIRVKPIMQSQQRFRIAEIEELSQTDDKQESPEIESHGEVNINPITVNRVPIGEACSPYEVIQIQTESGLFPVVMIYDTGSEVSLSNCERGPIVTNTKKGNKK